MPTRVWEAVGMARYPRKSFCSLSAKTAGLVRFAVFQAAAAEWTCLSREGFDVRHVAVVHPGFPETATS